MGELGEIEETLGMRIRNTIRGAVAGNNGTGPSFGSTWRNHGYDHATFDVLPPMKQPPTTLNTTGGTTGVAGAGTDARWTEYGQPSVGFCHGGVEFSAKFERALEETLLLLP